MNVRAPKTARIAALGTVTLLVAALLPLSAVSAVTGGATKLVITSTSLGVGNATAGVPFTVTVKAQDNSSVVATGFTDPVTFASNDPQAQVSPASPYTYLVGDNGSKDFGVTLKTAGSKTITFSAAGLTPATATITVDVGTTRQLVFVQQPSTSPASAAFLSQPAVAVQDAYGNRITTDSTTPVTFSITSGTPAIGAGTLTCAGTGSGGRTFTASSGLATAVGCNINGIGIGYRLDAADGTASPVAPHPYGTVASNLFDIADNLAFETQPGGGAGAGAKAQGGIAFTNQPKVTVRGGTTNKAVNDSTTIVTLGIRSGTGTVGAILTCDQPSNVLKVTTGSAQFTGCKIDKAGTGYQLVATSVPAYGVNAWYSTAFDVLAGPASKLTFTTQPAGAAAGQAFTTQPVVAITDAGGNVATTGVSANVTLTIGTNPGVPAGTLTCTPSQTVATATSGPNAGKAVFSGCKITNSGIGYTLVATATSVVCAAGACATPGVLSPGTSTAFTVTAPAAQIALTPSASVITWGGTVVLTTRFAVNGAGKTFTLQGARDGVSWATIATLITDANGNSSYAYRPVSNLYYRVVFAGTSDLIAGFSNTTRVVVRQKAFMRPTNSGTTRVVARNTKVTFTTTVRPARADLPPARVSFLFYRRVSTGWAFFTKRDVYINSAGQAFYTWTFSTRGEWYVRSVANPTPYNANSVMTPVERYSVR